MGFEMSEEGVVSFNGLTMEERKAEIAQRVEDRVIELRNEVAGRQAKLEVAWGVYEKLAALAAGRPTIKINYWSDENGISIDCELADLEPIAHVVGTLEESGKHIQDAKKKLVSIRRRSRRYNFVYVSYTVKLPKLAKGEKPKCRIETRRSVEKVLVCDL